mmetsp:Transcript_11260/g.27603  ORF Transcript_11260/g.27603 Transcript_11260/m.27603 type:complete len:227 (+) Transcript_11260:958-1638(+)
MRGMTHSCTSHPAIAFLFSTGASSRSRARSSQRATCSTRLACASCSSGMRLSRSLSLSRCRPSSSSSSSFMPPMPMPGPPRALDSRDSRMRSSARALSISCSYARVGTYTSCADSVQNSAYSSGVSPPQMVWSGADARMAASCALHVVPATTPSSLGAVLPLAALAPPASPSPTSMSSISPSSAPGCAAMAASSSLRSSGRWAWNTISLSSLYAVRSTSNWGSSLQ